MSAQCACATHPEVVVTMAGSEHCKAYCPVCLFQQPHNRELMRAFEVFVSVTREMPMSARQEKALLEIEKARIA